MISDTGDLAELHAMAYNIGLKRRWFQGGKFPHYDLRPSKRELALRHGAKEIGFRELGHLLIRLNKISTDFPSPTEALSD